MLTNTYISYRHIFSGYLLQETETCCKSPIYIQIKQCSIPKTSNRYLSHPTYVSRQSCHHLEYLQNLSSVLNILWMMTTLFSKPTSSARNIGLVFREQNTTLFDLLFTKDAKDFSVTSYSVNIQKYF